MNTYIDFGEFGERRPVRGGVQPRSRRGTAFAKTWWGRAFLEAVEQVADQGRLARGRSYARTGQVVNYRLEPGLVSAEVQGSQPRPFISVLTMRQLRDDRLTELVDLVRSTPGTLGEIAAGTLPKTLGPLLLPTTASELDFSCSCPDSGWPCKHVAAVCYVIAERLDEHPTELLTLRGVDLDDLIGSVQRQTPAMESADPYGNDIALPALPKPEFRPAPDDLDAVLLRQALRMTAEDEQQVAAGLRQLRALYRSLDA
ncbi:SWIM zinc finger family protein [Nocardia sp. CDC160]|uniref:SWIM zinc finger family protein n=1 Tax=Nocardia sp. CDC160 TaxID=3112166 RepID=UPI002DBE3FAD|nr:SWIM zinc finger family protein [Nocardia sp. CDC160]MEC3913028.1 SWIM zinc finger family protein [Nocardia sp. CDC160]